MPQNVHLNSDCHCQMNKAAALEKKHQKAKAGQQPSLVSRAGNAFSSAFSGVSTHSVSPVRITYPIMLQMATLFSPQKAAGSKGTSSDLQEPSLPEHLPADKGQRNCHP